jgi:hypothetical protein
MTEFFETTVRIEAVEVAHSIETTDPKETFWVPSRTGFRRTGGMKARMETSETILLELFGTAGMTQEVQTIEIVRFPSTTGSPLTCLRCPSCWQARKRLFLVEHEKTLFSRAPDPFAFICEKCVPQSKTTKTRMKMNSMAG